MPSSEAVTHGVSPVSSCTAAPADHYYVAITVAGDGWAGMTKAVAKSSPTAHDRIYASRSRPLASVADLAHVAGPHINDTIQFVQFGRQFGERSLAADL